MSRFTIMRKELNSGAVSEFITVDTHPIVGAANCGPFGLGWVLQ